MLCHNDGCKIGLAVGGGNVFIATQLVTVLADAVESPENIDLQRALAAKERARTRLQHRTDTYDIALAQAAVRRAMNRIRAADRRK